jgi:hypothetical protein
MKKLLLIAFLAFSMIGYSQSVVFPNSTQTLPIYLMDGDTSYVFGTSAEYYYDFQFVWDTLDQTDGSVKVQISNDGTNYSDYPNTDSLLFNSASGSSHIRDTYKGLAGRYLKLKVDSGTCSDGTLKIFGYLRNKE